jgi:formate hydrogenlyase transcriptional activator
VSPTTAADQFRTLLDVSASISAHRDVKALFRDLARLLRQVIQFDYLNLILYDAETDAMRLHVLETREAGPLPLAVPFPVDESPAGEAWRDQRTILVPDTRRASEWPQVMRLLVELGVVSCCYLPLTSAQRRLGAMGLGHLTPHEFTGQELAFLRTVAAQVAVAVDNALGHDELERERDRLRLLLEVTNTLVSSLEPRELFERITDELGKVIPHDYASVALIEAGGDLVIRALCLPGGSGLVAEQMAIPEDGSPARLALAELRIATFDEKQLKSMQSEGSRRLLAEGIKTLICVPLITRNGTLGTLNVGFARAHRAAESDIAILGQIAKQIAVAVENATAFGQISKLKDKLAEEKLYLEDELRTDRNFSEMVGESAAFKGILKQVETVAPTGASVLILGETGTGKELIARAIHQLSERSERTFVKLNCAAIPTGLLESELFGHEKGAFTGAIQQKIGRLELADKGTLFLDEVGDIPLELQPKLLRAIQEREFERLGSTRTIKVDFRLVAATNRDLQQMVGDREFRADLFYRLNVFPIHVPPLRERPDDVPLLVRYFTQKFSRRMNRGIETIPAKAMARLTRYSWPGNIRELENLIERAVILSPGESLRIPDPNGGGSDTSRPASALTLEDAEREHIIRAVNETDGRIGGPGGAAARLGLKRSTLQSRMKKLGIGRPRANRA